MRNFPLKNTASGSTGGKSIVRTADPLSGDKPVRGGFLTVMEAAPFTLELVSLGATIEQEQSAKLDVLALRREGFSGEIKLSAEGYAAGRDPITKSFSVKETTLKAGEALGQISLKPRLDSEVGTRTIVVKGQATLDGQPVVEY